MISYHARKANKINRTAGFVLTQIQLSHQKSICGQLVRRSAIDSSQDIHKDRKQHLNRWQSTGAGPASQVSTSPEESSAEVEQTCCKWAVDGKVRKFARCRTRECCVKTMLPLMLPIYTASDAAGAGTPSVAFCEIFCLLFQRPHLTPIPFSISFNATHLVSTTRRSKSQSLIREELPAHGKGSGEDCEAVGHCMSFCRYIREQESTYAMTTPKGSSSGGIFLRDLSRWVMVCAVKLLHQCLVLMIFQ
jgi:hypothetical protein